MSLYFSDFCFINRANHAGGDPLTEALMSLFLASYPSKGAHLPSSDLQELRGNVEEFKVRQLGRKTVPKGRSGSSILGDVYNNVETDVVYRCMAKDHKVSHTTCVVGIVLLLYLGH